MIKVAGVRFKSAGRVYYFDPGELDLHTGDNVVVETARGVEFGTVSADIKEVSESEIVSTLKPVLRIATEEDVKVYQENEAKKEKALSICQDKITRRGLDMKLVDVEYTFDNSKVIFYFTSDGRVDFRELVKDLAGVFKMRIELRQIGVRDETKMMGGIGTCGRPLCCNSWLPDFAPVSIKMAKVQNLSLNPTKISGICGRLMCCLQYENETYVENRKGMPDVGEKIKTEDGPALVMDVNYLEDKVKTRLILEESSGDRPDKLSTEYYVYEKKDIERLEKKKPAKAAEAPQGGGKGKKNRRKGNIDESDLSKMSQEELEALTEE